MSCDILKLREKVRGYMSEKRYRHTLGVEASVRQIAEYCLPDSADELAIAALLHDISKEKPVEVQREYAIKSGFTVTDDDLSTLSALHSFAAPYLIKCDFPELATKDILSATFNHTVGAPDMSLFDEIVFVADYIEENREYVHCKQMRKFLFDNLSLDASKAENIRALHRTLVQIIDFTIRYLNDRNMIVNERTILTKNAFSTLI